MMNEQRGLELPWSVQQQVFDQQIDRQRRRERRFVVGTGLLLFLVLLFTVWGDVTLAPPRTHQLEFVAHVTPHVQQPTPTVQAAPGPQSALIASQVDNFVTGQVNRHRFSGSVLIAQDGQVLLSKGYSMANWDSQVSNTPHTQFYLGSTTKQFTAMAILILQERGKLHVRDHLCSHIAHCPSAWQPVTIHELLTHTSGIPQLDDSSLSDASPEAWIASYDGVSLAFTPGSQYSYCSVCYQILGYVIEQASGQPYSAFLQQAIFNPLQMKNTGFDPHDLSASESAVGYAGWQIKAVSLDWTVDPRWSFLFGSGLLHTTVEDLFRWDQTLYTHTLVSQKTLDEAFTPYYVSQYAGSSYGYGWFIAKAPVQGHRLIWHDGRIDGFRSYIGRYIDDHITIIFLSNLATLDELAFAHSLEQIVFDRTSFIHAPATSRRPASNLQVEDTGSHTESQG
jgi:CubicO group peptidase (beta-lactamase class C family)